MSTKKERLKKICELLPGPDKRFSYPVGFSIAKRNKFTVEEYREVINSPYFIEYINGYQKRTEDALTKKIELSRIREDSLRHGDST